MTSGDEDAPTRTEVDGVRVLGSLSPSRAGEFTSCALLYRFRTVDRLPEPPSVPALRGTVVHRVLQDLFDLPAGERTPARALSLLAPAWEAIVAAEPYAAEQVGDAVALLLTACRPYVERYFELEDPRRLEPAERELYVEALLDSRLLLRGVVDRLDVTADGRVRVVDYKTGSAPGVEYEARALFQLRFYALVLWRATGRIPASLLLVYLGSGQTLSYSPDKAELVATERKVEAVWAAIRHAEATGDWQPQRSPRCGWCPHRDICPAWGGTPPPLPERAVGGASAVEG